MFCKNCGAKINNSEIEFCPECGKPLKESKSLKTLQTPTPEKKSGGKLLVVIIIVLLVGILVAGAILFYKKKSDDDRNDKIEAFEVSVSSFKGLKTQYKLGQYEKEYDKILDRCYACIEEKNENVIDVLKDQMDEIKSNVIANNDKEVNEYKQSVDALKKELKESQKAQADASLKQAESLLTEQKYKDAYKLYEKALEELKEQQKQNKDTPKPTPEVKQQAPAQKTPVQEKPQPKAKISGYIFADSDSRFIDGRELKGYTAAELRLIRNEIYARRGRLFDSKDVQDYFDQCSWYCGYIKPNDFDESCFNKFEKANVDTIVSVENKFK